MLRYLSVKDQSVTGVATTSPVSQRPARRSLGSSPTTRSTTSATRSTATIAPATIRSFFIFPLYRSALPSSSGGEELERMPLLPRRLYQHPARADECA